MAIDKLEVIYYELQKIEQSVTQKAERIIQAESRIIEEVQKLQVLVERLEKPKSGS